MRRFFVAAIVVALALATGAAAARRQGSDTLQLNATLQVSRSSTPCPAGTSTSAACFKFTGSGTVPGLGSVTDEHTVISDDSNPDCVLLSFTPDVLTVGSKGTIDSSISVSAPCNGVPSDFVVTGGSGAYAGAHGGGSFTPNLVQGGAVPDNGDDSYIDDDDMDIWHSDIWTGTITVPGHSFDLAPPTISGAVSKTVRARKGVKRVRVTFNVTAVDTVDGSVPVSCTPRSGSLFKVGRTTVTCSATDSSANTATAHLTITVKRHR